MTPFSPSVTQQSAAYFRQAISELMSQVDRMFAWLLAVEWLGMMATALVMAPRTWNAGQSSVHPHVWATVLAGPAFILPAIFLAVRYPARGFTRHCISAAQMLVSIVLIDVTGGRIETHFHIFGSLAFLAFYRDWRVLITASAITAIDHVIRGVWWPQWVYGSLTVNPLRWVEHAGWVIFEDFFLILSIRRSIAEMWAMAISRAQLHSGAYHDVLTGLANRRQLEEAFAAPDRIEAPRAILYIDLDRFKQANDTLGHTIGDKLLVSIAKRLSAATGAGDTLARVGGDEFVVLMREVTSGSAALELGSRLLNALSKSFSVEGHELLLSASIGIALSPEHGVDLEALQERADRAMYVAKAKGRNQCAIFSSDVARRENILKEIARDLSSAMARSEMAVHFQPQVDRSGHLSGFEALLRWTHPVHGPIPPSDFIPLAERSGLIVAMGEWVLSEACRNCVSWSRRGYRFGVAVNVSAVQFELPDFPNRVARILEDSGMDPALLTLELTESALLKDTARTARQLGGLRESGVRIALDDFGTGYSSLSYLALLPADTIKLDRSFVNQQSSNATAIIESVIDMAHRVGLQVVGEGVETPAQNERLLDMNCDSMQGFFFSRPMAAEAVVEFIENQHPVKDAPQVAQISGNR